MNYERTYHLATLGCKVNQYETQNARELLEANGYREAQRGERADLCLVNTCTVTHEADAQGRQLVRRLARENPGTALVVTGCYATREPETIARLPGVVKPLFRPFQALPGRQVEVPYPLDNKRAVRLPASANRILIICARCGGCSRSFSPRQPRRAGRFANRIIKY